MLGFEQFKWKRRKTWRHFKSRIKELSHKLELWRGDLKQIEGNFGTGVVAFFLFIRWLLFLNLSIFSLILLFIILPNVLFDAEQPRECPETIVISPIDINMENQTSCCAAKYLNYSESNENIIDWVQGTGKAERTVLFYGIYTNITFDYVIGAITMYFNAPLSYLLTIVAVFLLSLAAIVKSAVKGFKERLVEGEGQFYQYCNLIFGGWDYCTQNEKSAGIKHKALFTEIKACLEVERLEEERKNRTTREKTTLFLVRLAVNIIVVSILTASATGIYFAFDFSIEMTKNSTQFESDRLFEDSETILQLFYQFLPSLAIVLLNIFVPFTFRALIGFERYTPIVVIRLSLVRTIFLRLSSLVVLLASIYIKITCDRTKNDCAINSCNFCWESYVGQQFYKLVLTDFITHVFLTFFVNFPRAIVAKHSENKLVKIFCEQEFDLPKHVLDVIYLQTLCWLGAFYSPLLPAICSVISFLLFYIKKFACLVNSQPSSTVYRASRSNSMFMVVMLVSFIFSALPIVYSVGELRPSFSCGPFRDKIVVWESFVETFNLSPGWLQSFVFFFGTAGFAVPVFVILCLLLYYFHAVNSANRHMVAVLKSQLVLEGHDKQFLLDRLSMFIKQQQDLQKRLRHTEIMREGERGVNNIANSN